MKIFVSDNLWRTNFSVLVMCHILVSYSRTLSPIPVSELFLHAFPEHVIILTFTLKSSTILCNVFVCHSLWIWVLYFCTWISNCPRTDFWKSFFSLWMFLACLSKTNWWSLWVSVAQYSSSVPLICLYMLHYFIHYNVAINFTGRLESSNCLLFWYYYSPCESPGLTYEF